MKPMPELKPKARKPGIRLTPAAAAKIRKKVDALSNKDNGMKQLASLSLKDENY